MSLEHDVFLQHLSNLMVLCSDVTVVVVCSVVTGEVFCCDWWCVLL